MKTNSTETNAIKTARNEMEPGSDIHCPYCGARVCDHRSDEPAVAACPHTLFASTDFDLLYISGEYAEALGIEQDADLGSIGHEHGVFGALEQFRYAIALETYEQAPSFAGLYMAFAPKSDEKGAS